MKNLYITDLDGTLLNKNSQLSTFTKNKLNELIESGVLFTISTARTPATITNIFEGVNLLLPISCMNGACLYNIAKNEFEKAFVIDKNAINQVIDVFEKNNLHGFFFNANKDKLYTLCLEPNNTCSITYFNERKDLPHKYFVIKNSYAEIKESDICFVSCLNEKAYIERLAELLKGIENINVCYYKDHEKELYFLEISSSDAGKGKTLNYLASTLDIDKKIAFGDNINDIELLETADISYAVENAHPIVKSVATEVIGSNEDDSVVKKILLLEHFVGV